MVADANRAAVGACTGSCTLQVPAGDVRLAPGTPASFGGIASATAFQCSTVSTYDCTVEVRAGQTTSVTVTFQEHAKARWTFFGDINEYFGSAAFDHVGRLVASSNTRLAQLDPAGQLRWARALPGAVLIGLDDAIYVSDATSTTKLDPDGNNLWVRPGIARAIDARNGNVLVVEGTTMRMITPSNTLVWTATGRGEAIDGAGVIYESFTTLDPEWPYYTRLEAHRYSANDGSPLADFGALTTYVEYPSFAMIATATRVAAFAQNVDSNSTINGRVHDAASGMLLAGFDAVLYQNFSGLPASLAGAGDDVGFLHGFEAGNFCASYELARLVPQRVWTVRYDGHETFEDSFIRCTGPRVGTVGGGPSGQLAALGQYKSSLYGVGLIQVFAP